MKIKIVKRDGEHAIEFWQGSQGFTLDYRASRKECEWMRKQLRHAFRAFIQGKIDELRKKLK